MIDLKGMKAALEQLEEERGISKDKIMTAITDSLVAAYKKDYGKRGQIIRGDFDMDSGKLEFYQVKIVVDDQAVLLEGMDRGEDDDRPRFNEEQHIMLEDARKIKKDCQVNDELIFPLETQDDFGRIAAQTAKQVIIQRLREAEKVSILGEYEGKEGEIVMGKVQKIDRGNIFVDLDRTTAVLPFEEQIPGERHNQGERIRAYLFRVEDTSKGVMLKLSRSHPKFVEQLFAVEAPEIQSGLVEIKAIAREAGSRTKIAVATEDPNIDPVGSCVGQRGSRVNTVITELGGEKIDIIEWATNPSNFITNALSPAKVKEVTLNEEEHAATILVEADQFSLAVGKGGQNVRLAAKLTGWRIDIITPEGSDLPLNEVLSDVEKEQPTASEEGSPTENEEVSTEEPAIEETAPVETTEEQIA